MARYYGVPLRNAVSIGLGGIIALATAEATPLPGPPWQVASSAGVVYNCDTIVLDSAGTAFVCVDSVKDSAGTEYFPI
jgi:hypothetical protein